MVGFFAITALLLAATAAQADVISVSTTELQTHWNLASLKGSPVDHAAPPTLLLKDRGSFVTIHAAADSPGKNIKKPGGEPADDLDLREVDWEKVKAGKKGKNRNGGNGEKEDGNGEDEKEGEEGGGGWDRVWEAPKLG